jgi:hypothetical protein
MKLTVTTSHELVFAVEAFWSEEGGMGQDQFGENVATLEEAVALLMHARASRKSENWIITIQVTTKSTVG